MSLLTITILVMWALNVLYYALAYVMGKDAPMSTLEMIGYLAVYLLSCIHDRMK